MTLDYEWFKRIESWRNRLLDIPYERKGNLEVSAFFTSDHLRYEEAVQRSFEPVRQGQAWGERGESGWFRSQIEVTPELEGSMLAFDLDAGEGLLWINGEEYTLRANFQRKVTILIDTYRAGDRIDIVAEYYAGHGPTPIDSGPLRPGESLFKAPPGKRVVIGEPSFGVWHQDINELYIECNLLFRLRGVLDPQSLRCRRIDEALRKFATVIDVEAPIAEIKKMLPEGHRLLRPALACVNGSTMPMFHLFGHGHLDVAFLWTLAEGNRKAARTFAAQLNLAKRFPTHRFLQSQPYVYLKLKENYPRLYARIKQAVAAGNVIADGGMWVEADTNVPSGESLIRQLVHGKKFFREEFGVDSRILWLPDVFGYSAALPQIMRGCEMDGFLTAKLYWNRNDRAPFPINTFSWEGIDGTRVPAQLMWKYDGSVEPQDLAERYSKLPLNSTVEDFAVTYGWGDGGGGPTWEMCEYIPRLRDLEGLPRTKMSSPSEFFADLLSHGQPRDVYVGELYFPAHRGTYTSQARVKRYNRMCEIGLREAEAWSAIAHLVKARPVAYSQLDEAWKIVLLHQFHDILPGSSIEPVYRLAHESYERALTLAAAQTRESTEALLEPSAALTVFNSLGWPRFALVELPGEVGGLTDHESRSVPTQILNGTRFAELRVPSFGWASYEFDQRAPNSAPGQSGDGALENELLKVTFSPLGEIDSIFDKETGFELAKGPCNAFKLYSDIPARFDAWDIADTCREAPVECTGNAKLTSSLNGPLFSAISIERGIGVSILRQTIMLRARSRTIEFRTEVDWHEKHRLLKVNFPVAVRANSALHEIQCGALSRPNDFSTPAGRERFEVSNQKWTALVEANRGIAVLNDCKYGIGVEGNSMNLTLLKSPLAPDEHADQGRHEFTYALYSWNGPLIQSRLLQEAFELNVKPVVARGTSQPRSLFQISAPNVILDTVKMADDESGDLVCRLYEALGTETAVTVYTELFLRSVASVNMLERGPVEIPHDARSLRLHFRAFEIKTLRLSAMAA